MNWRLGLALLVIGGVLLFWGIMEWRLGRGASSTPERMTLKQLIARGPAGNSNIILTDFAVCDNYVYHEKNGRWDEFYVPIVPTDEVVPGQLPAPRGGVKAILFSINIHSQSDIAPVLGKHELPALVTNSIKELGSEETKLLQSKYAGLDPKKCLMIQEGRKLMSGAVLALIFGGGIVLLLGGIGMIAANIMRNRPQYTTRRRRRPRDDEDDEDRPRKRRERDDDDEDDRPRKRRPRDEDEDDEPRPKRRRLRDEEDE